MTQKEQEDYWNKLYEFGFKDLGFAIGDYVSLKNGSYLKSLLKLRKFRVSKIIINYFGKADVRMIEKSGQFRIKNKEFATINIEIITHKEFVYKPRHYVESTFKVSIFDLIHYRAILIEKSEINAPIYNQLFLNDSQRENET